MIPWEKNLVPHPKRRTEKRPPLMASSASSCSAPGCDGCIHLHSSGYAYWCAKDGHTCTRGGNPKQAGCFEPND